MVVHPSSQPYFGVSEWRKPREKGKAVTAEALLRRVTEDCESLHSLKYRSLFDVFRLNAARLTAVNSACMRSWTLHGCAPSKPCGEQGGLEHWMVACQPLTISPNQALRIALPLPHVCGGVQDLTIYETATTYCLQCGN